MVILLTVVKGGETPGSKERNPSSPSRVIGSVSYTWTILAAWLALQIPLGTLLGKCIKFASTEQSLPGRGLDFCWWPKGDVPNG
jgi:hypothetical protein